MLFIVQRKWFWIWIEISTLVSNARFFWDCLCYYLQFWFLFQYLISLELINFTINNYSFLPNQKYTEIWKFQASKPIVGKQVLKLHYFWKVLITKRTCLSFLNKKYFLLSILVHLLLNDLSQRFYNVMDGPRALYSCACDQ